MKFVTAINTPGGHILVGFAMILLGAAFTVLGIDEGHELIGGGSMLVGRTLMDQHATKKPE